MYLYKVVNKIIIVVALSSIMPIIFYQRMEEGILRFLLVGIICILSVLTFIYTCGITQSERRSVKYYFKMKLKK